ncbi:deoxyuridine 5'-triphosphate nucleotidohydrolase [Spirochaetia bacterium]|nr:deoxyuridine 5'-triphosphate nucleotidohydrolase [Spirochaetia bacterium]
MGIIVKFKKISPDAIVPAFQTEGAAGADVFACLKGAVTVPAGGITVLPTGIALEIPAGYEAQVRPRSGLAARHGVTILNSPGTIDSDYRGELRIILINLGKEAWTVKTSDRIAQLIFAPVIHADFIEVQCLTNTSRGEGGFGSTGK